MLGFIRNTNTKTGLVVIACLDRKSILPVSSPTANSSHHSISNQVKHYRNGITPSRPICEVNFASTLSDVPGEDRDEPYQRAMFFAHGDINGYDFWGEPEFPDGAVTLHQSMAALSFARLMK
jgi:hypothetical protein